MAGPWKVRLDRAGVGGVLRSPAAHKLTGEAARRVAAGVTRVDPTLVVVEPYTTDRGAAAVVVRDPQAVGLQAKYGILTAAARAAGLKVRARR